MDVLRFVAIELRCPTGRARFRQALAAAILVTVSVAAGSLLLVGVTPEVGPDLAGVLR